MKCKKCGHDIISRGEEGILYCQNPTCDVVIEVEEWSK